MKIDIEQKLFDKYPDLLKDLPHFEVGEGWFSLIDEMCEELTKFDIRLVQVKSKFSCLRVYFNLPSGDYGMIDEIIRKYELRSQETCEVCGEPGDKVVLGGWLAIRCEKHHAEWKARNGG